MPLVRFTPPSGVTANPGPLEVRVVDEIYTIPEGSNNTTGVYVDPQKFAALSTAVAAQMPGATLIVGSE